MGLAIGLTSGCFELDWTQPESNGWLMIGARDDLSWTGEDSS